MPLVARHASVVVDVEIVEAVVAIVIEAVAEELGDGDRVVAVPVDAAERLEIEMPLVGGQPSVTVVVEVVEPLLGPADLLLVAARPVIRGAPIGGALGPEADLVAAEHAVAVPVVVREGAIGTPPLGAGDATVVIGIHLLEPHP